ncbi:MAG: HAD-IIB family hydrolase [Clostridia bacterium]|nr:HAD-IIB family hydrolase [Clostridia bacterium]
MKIIASDYDGTINYNGVSKEDRDAIAKFRKAGNKFGVNTGRDLEMALWILHDMKGELDFLICCTGAIIVDGSGSIIYEKRQKIDHARHIEIINEARRLGFGNFSVSDRLTRVYMDRNDKIPCALDLLSEFTQTNLWFMKEESGIEFLKYLDENHADYMKGFRNGGAIDIPPLGSSKPTGLIEYAKMFDNVDEIYTVGDNLNDIPMLEAFCSFAVSNAQPEVKEIAKHQCNRIADMIEFILEGK